MNSGGRGKNPLHRLSTSNWPNELEYEIEYDQSRYKTQIYRGSSIIMEAFLLH